MHKRFELLIHFIRLLMKLITPGGAKALVAENLALKQQLFTLNRRRLRSPALTTFDRAFFGVLAQLISPNRIKKIAVVLKPATIINFHRALVNHKISKRIFASSIEMKTPSQIASNKNANKNVAQLESYRWKTHCNGLYQYPVAA